MQVELGDSRRAPVAWSKATQWQARQDRPVKSLRQGRDTFRLGRLLSPSGKRAGFDILMDLACMRLAARYGETRRLSH